MFRQLCEQKAAEQGAEGTDFMPPPLEEEEVEEDSDSERGAGQTARSAGQRGAVKDEMGEEDSEDDVAEILERLPASDDDDDHDDGHGSNVLFSAFEDEEEVDDGLEYGCSPETQERIRQWNEIEMQRLQERIAKQAERQRQLDNDLDAASDFAAAGRAGRVTFKSVQVREYGRLLGGSSCVLKKGAIALGLSNEYEAREPQHIDLYEAEKHEAKLEARAQAARDSTGEEEEDEDDDFFDVTPARNRSKLLLQSSDHELVEILKRYEARLQNLIRKSRHLTLYNDSYCVRKLCNGNEFAYVGCHPDSCSGLPASLHGQTADCLDQDDGPPPGLSDYDQVPVAEVSAAEQEAQDKALRADLARIDQDIRQCIADKESATEEYHRRKAAELELAAQVEAAKAASLAAAPAVGKSAESGADAFATFMGTFEGQGAASGAGSVVRRSRRATMRRASVGSGAGNDSGAVAAAPPTAGDNDKPAKGKGKATKSAKNSKKASKAATNASSSASASRRRSSSSAQPARSGMRTSSRRLSRRCSLSSGGDTDPKYTAALAKYERMKVSELKALLTERNLPRTGDTHGMARRLAQAEVDSASVATVDDLAADTDALDKLAKKQRGKRRRGSGRFEPPTARHRLSAGAGASVDSGKKPEPTIVPEQSEPFVCEDDDDEFNVSLSDLMGDDGSAAAVPATNSSVTVLDAQAEAATNTQSPTPPAGVQNARPISPVLHVHGSSSPSKRSPSISKRAGASSDTTASSDAVASPVRMAGSATPPAAGPSSTVFASGTPEVHNAGMRSRNHSPGSKGSPRHHPHRRQSSPGMSPRSRRWYTLSVSDLKDELQKHGLRPSDNKTDMVQRLRAKVVTPTKPKTAPRVHGAKGHPSPPMTAHAIGRIAEASSATSSPHRPCVSSPSVNKVAAPVSAAAAPRSRRASSPSGSGPEKNTRVRGSLDDSFSVASFGSFGASDANFTASFYNGDDDDESVHLSDLENDTLEPADETVAPKCAEGADQADRQIEGAVSPNETRIPGASASPATAVPVDGTPRPASRRRSAVSPSVVRSPKSAASNATGGHTSPTTSELLNVADAQGAALADESSSSSDDDDTPLKELIDKHRQKGNRRRSLATRTRAAAMLSSMQSPGASKVDSPARRESVSPTITSRPSPAPKASPASTSVVSSPAGVSDSGTASAVSPNQASASSKRRVQDMGISSASAQPPEKSPRRDAATRHATGCASQPQAAGAKAVVHGRRRRRFTAGPGIPVTRPMEASGTAVVVGARRRRTSGIGAVAVPASWGASQTAARGQSAHSASKPYTHDQIRYLHSLRTAEGKRELRKSANLHFKGNIAAAQSAMLAALGALPQHCSQHRSQPPLQPASARRGSSATGASVGSASSAGAASRGQENADANTVSSTSGASATVAGPCAPAASTRQRRRAAPGAATSSSASSSTSAQAIARVGRVRYVTDHVIRDYVDKALQGTKTKRT